MQDDRTLKDWSSLTAAGAPSLPWGQTFMLAIAGIMFSVYALLMLLPLIPLSYVPYRGIVGVPALLNVPSKIDLYVYAAGTILSFAVGLGLIRLASRARSTGIFSVCMLLLGVLLLIVASHASQSDGVGLLRDLLNAPMGILQLIGIGFSIYFLGSRPRSLSLTQALKRTPSETFPGHSEVTLLDRFNAFAPLLVVSIILLVPALPSPVMAVLIAHPLALMLTPCFYPDQPDQHRTHSLLLIERIIWGLMLLLPVPFWLLRLGRSLDWDVPSFEWLFALVMVLFALAITVGFLRLRRAVARPFNPAFFVPWLLLAMVALGAGYARSYDPFHQGERIFAPHAADWGAEAFRDIFYVHGYGVNTWLGRLAVPVNPAIHSIDNYIYGIIAGICMALLAWQLLRLFGTNWWPMVLAISLFGLLSSGLTGARFLPLWIALWMVLKFQQTGRGRWLSLLGLLGWLSLYFSLDTGFITLVSSGAFCAIWGFLGLYPKMSRDSNHSLSVRIQPLIWLGIGATAGLVITSVWLLAIGALGSFWQTFFDYLRMKHHYDKLPFYPGQLTLLLGPAIVIAGMYAFNSMRRLREASDLAAAIYFLLPVAFITLTRGLDRADTGHMIYATLPCWPLLGCLLVWRTRGEMFTYRGPESISFIGEGSKLMRAMAFFGLLALLPYAHTTIRGQDNEPPVPRIHQLVRHNLENPTLPLCGPIDDAYIQFFFDMCADLKARLAPGTYLLDLSNEPAIYPWANLKAPSRFYAAFYMAGIEWQDEVVRDMQRHETAYVLWLGPNVYWNAPDSIPNYIRQWWVARHILANFRPAWLTAGGGLIAEPSELARYVRNPVNELVWRRPIDLELLPWVIGQNQQAFYDGTPVELQRMTVTVNSLPTPATYLPRKPDTPADILEIRAAGLQYEILDLWFGKSPIISRPDRPADVSFKLMGPESAVYMLPLSSIPAWVWGDSTSVWIEGREPVTAQPQP